MVRLGAGSPCFLEFVFIVKEEVTLTGMLVLQRLYPMSKTIRKGKSLLEENCSSIPLHFAVPVLPFPRLNK